MSAEELKNKIKDIPVSNIIGLYLPLDKRGGNFYARCPWHDDTKPSLVINDEKGLWRCFVDDIGGDAITFVQRYEDSNFIDALKSISEKIGIPHEEYLRQKTENPKLIMAKKVTEKAAQLYRKIALSNKFSAYKNFLKERHIPDETAEKFMLGMAPPTSALYQYLESISDQEEKKKAMTSAIELGIIKKGRNDSTYDAFRNRIVFPFWDSFGTIVGFSTRAVEKDQKPKYINSRESILYHKKNVLYGYNFAKSKIRETKSLLIVEGQMDCIALHAHGFDNTIAISGTALADSAIGEIQKMAKNIYLALDNDEAGFKAMERIHPTFLAKNLWPKFVDFSPHKDPDEFINSEGVLAFKERIDAAKPFIEVVWEKQFSAKREQDLETRIAALQQYLKLLRPAKDTLQAKEYALKAAQDLQMKSSEDEILKELKGEASPQKTLLPQNKNPNTQQKQGVNKSPAEYKGKSIEKMSKLLLQHIIKYPSLMERADFSEVLDFVGNSEVKKTVLAIKDTYYEVDDEHFKKVVRNLIESDQTSMEVRQVLGSFLFSDESMGDGEQTDKLFQDLKKKLELEKLKNQKESLKLQLAEGSSVELINAIHQLDKKIHKVISEH